MAGEEAILNQRAGIGIAAAMFLLCARMLPLCCSEDEEEDKEGNGADFDGDMLIDE